ncbi:AI-2E family transporter [bacterium]|nr:AI-2E family transporter [bacterium]
MTTRSEKPVKFNLFASPGNISTLCLVFIAVVLLLAVFKVGYAVIMPPLVAWFLSLMLEPPIGWFVSKKIPRSLSIAVVLVLLMVAMYWFAVLLSVNAAGFINQMPALQGKFSAILQDILRHVPVQLNDNIDAQMSKWLTQAFESLMAMLGKLLGSLTTFLSNLIFVIIILAFILVARPYTQHNLKRAFTRDVAEQVSRITASVTNKISKYILMQTLLSMITGFLVWLLCALLGLKFAFTWGMLAFFLNFIPTIGSIIAALPPVLLALIQFYPNVWPAIIIVLVILVINQVIGNVISPKVMGDQLDLSPIVILIFLLLCGWLWGILGAFLSVIFAVALKIICEHIPVLRPLGIMMASGKTPRGKN